MKSAQRKEQPEKSATRKGCKMRKVNHEKSKSETRKSAARKMCNMKIVQHEQSIEIEQNLGKSAKEKRV